MTWIANLKKIMIKATFFCNLVINFGGLAGLNSVKPQSSSGCPLADMWILHGPKRVETSESVVYVTTVS